MRKSKYKADFCVKIIEHGKRGLPIETFGVTLPTPVSRTALYDWAKKYPEFKEAMEIAKEFAHLKACIQNEQVIEGKIKATANLIFKLKQYGWKDTQEIEEKSTLKVELSYTPQKPD